LQLLRCGREIDRMTEYLIAVRAVIVLWTNLAVMPAEIVFDAIEAELERRGTRYKSLWLRPFVA
jgi:hypothetical protein